MDFPLLNRGEFYENFRIHYLSTWFVYEHDKNSSKLFAFISQQNDLLKSFTNISKSCFIFFCVLFLNGNSESENSHDLRDFPSENKKIIPLFML